MNELGKKAAELMCAIDHQIFVPAGVVWKACPGCAGVGRDGRLCYACLRQELAYVVGAKAAREYLMACLTLREARQTVMETAERGV